MKQLLSFVFFLLSTTLFAQQKPTELDKSPMDMSYWPANYPLLKMSGKAKELPVARVIYSRPLKNGRTIFGGIIKYDELWRLGANEATEIELFSNVKIGSKALAKGRYTVYCIPSITKWTLIFNKDNYVWGSFTYDGKKDALRVDIDVDRNTESVEAFTIYFEETKTGTNMIILWDDTKVTLPVAVVDESATIKKKS